MNQSDVDRFLRYVDKVPDGCWTWTGGRTSNGYGSFSLAGRHVSAHRFAFETFTGPFPAGTEADHLCRNRACVNPDHIEAVTHAENIRRKEAVWRATGRCRRGRHEWTPETTAINTTTGYSYCTSCHKESVQRRNARLRQQRLASAS